MSGNDAATAIAIAAGAKIDPATTDPYSTFIEAMNQKAKELGCTDTVLRTPMASISTVGRAICIRLRAT